MSKKIRKQVSPKTALSENRKATNRLTSINSRSAMISIFIIVLLGLIIFYKPYVIDRLEPAGGDKMASAAQSKYTTDYRKQTGELTLWNPSIFCGIPTYFAIWPASFNLDYLISKINPLIDWKLSWFILGAIGLFLLLHELGFAWYYALIGVIAFLFYPHYQALINVGHFAKIRAVCALPLVVYGFFRLVKKQNCMSFILFVIFFSLQLRTQHYQIIFYTLLLLMTIGIWQIIDWIKTAQSLKITKALGLFILAMVVAILMSAQPLFVANEYTPYSTRGGHGISLKADPTQSHVKSGGVTFEYATRWSLNPKELATLIVPRFYGGTSQEPYNGKAYPQLHGRYLPGYWGDMPFTQSSEYMGILTVILALLGLWYFRRDGFVLSLFALLVFSVLLAFGNHFAILYKCLFLHLPYFSKFRVPSMILILVDFILILLSLYGLKGLLDNFDVKKYKVVLIISGFFVVFGLLFLLAPGTLSYTSAQDAQYLNNPQVMEMLRTVRMEFMRTDTLRMLVLVVCFIGLVVLFNLKKLRSDFLLVGVLLLVAIDMISVSKRFLNADELVDNKSLERRYFAETKFDKIMLEDKELFRVMGLGSLFQSNDLAYRYQLVTGYSPIKPQLIQDIIDNNLFYGSNRNAINWNIVNMLNARYIIAPGMLNEPHLTVLDVNQQNKLVLFLNEAALPRAFFVEKVKTLPSEKEVMVLMNTAVFNPAKIALTTEVLDSTNVFDVNGSVAIMAYTPNRIDLQVETEGRAFLVLADAYYPKGWLARIAGRETHIYQINHVLRGIEVPSGNYEVVFEFMPRSFQKAALISSIANDLIWLGLIGLVIFNNRHKIKQFGPIKRFFRNQ